MITREQDRQIRDLGLKFQGSSMYKFCRNPRGWYREAVKIAVGLGLDGSTRRAILDIGSGFGYFAAACKAMGHDIVGLDLPDDAIAEASSILGVPYCPHRITYDDMLPPIFGYDLITTFGVNFRDFNGEYWHAYHYNRLAYEVERRLRDGGRWVVRPNQDTSGEPRIAMLADLAWWQDIAGDGATITGTPIQVEIRWTD